MNVILYKQDVNKTIREWSIKGSIERGEAIIEITHGVRGGAAQIKEERITEGKASRSLEEQLQSRMASRIGKQRDKGYVNSLAKARTFAPTNQLNLKRPMLAQKFKGTLPNEFYLQYKFDGNRCLIHNNGSRIIAYTRAGKENPNLEHIIDQLDIPVGATLDGELYHHGTPLQTIRSWVSRKQEDTKKLQYMAYDMITDEPYYKRLEALNNLSLGPSISIVETVFLDRFKLELEGGIKILLSEARKKGYEGLIARTNDLGYEDGKRSKSLIKIKEWEDAEFRIIDIISSADGWAILVCISEGGTFKVSAPGPIPEKEEVLRNKKHYIGKHVTAEYAYLTKSGIPFHPVAIAFRERGE